MDEAYTKWCFFNALVLMVLTKFVQNSTIVRCSSCTNFFRCDAKLNAKLAPNVMQI